MWIRIRNTDINSNSCLGPGHCDGCEARLPDDPHPRTYGLQGFHLYFMSIREHLLADQMPGLRIRIGSGFNRVSGSVSGFGIRIRIQEGNNDPQK
jgi:hypothetical protein